MPDIDAEEKADALASQWAHSSGAWPHAIHDADGKTVAECWKGNAHADLIAAAPDLARVLLAVEWHRVLIQGEDAYVCPSCGNERLDPGDEVKLPALVAHGMLGHRPDCALDAAIRKAGLR